MEAFISWFQRYRILILFPILFLSSWITLWVLDESSQQLNQVRQNYQQNQISLALWQDYRAAVEERSSLIPLLKRYRRIPLWTRAKVRESIRRLAEIYGLTLREYQFTEQASDDPSMKEGEQYHRVNMSLGASTDTQIFDFLEHLNTHLAPWVKPQKVLLQRCGSVEDPADVDQEEEVEDEQLDPPQIDIVEVRIDLDWLLTLEGNKHGKK